MGRGGEAPGGGVGTQAVRADEAEAGLAGALGHLAFQLGVVGSAGLAEAAGEELDGADALVAGGVALDITVTPWLLTFSMFIFLSLALVKRYSELRFLQSHGMKSVTGRAYLVDEMDLLLSLGPTTGCLSILVLALYISESAEVNRLYSSVPLLWFLCPVLLYWIMRLWFIARRGELPEDPVAFTLTDRNSILVGALALVLLVVASRWSIF